MKFVTKLGWIAFLLLLIGISGCKRTLSRRDFKYDNYQWVAMLPPEQGTFHGKQVKIAIDPTAFDQHQVPPREFAFVESLLPRLPDIFTKVDEALRTYNKSMGDETSYLQNLADPCIYIPYGLDSTGAWVFDVDKDERHGVGWQCDFKGTEFQRAWQDN